MMNLYIFCRPTNYTNSSIPFTYCLAPSNVECPAPGLAVFFTVFRCWIVFPLSSISHAFHRTILAGCSVALRYRKRFTTALTYARYLFVIGIVTTSSCFCKMFSEILVKTFGRAKLPMITSKVAKCFTTDETFYLGMLEPRATP